VVEIRSPARSVVVVTTYDLGHRSQLVALLAGSLEAELKVVDASADESCLRSAITASDDVVLAAPMLTGASIAREFLVAHEPLLANRRVLVIGAYASTLAALAPAWHEGWIAIDRDDPELVAAILAGREAHPRGGRRHYRARPATLGPLETYRHLVRDGSMVLAGYVETTLGCRHTCRHCPVAGVWHGRLVVLDADDVLADAEAQIAAGARHLSLGDADFLSAPRHALGVLRALHERHPELTFDVTIKVAELAANPGLARTLAELGVIFVISAVEILRDDILAVLAKGHTSADVLAVRDALFEAGVGFHPTFIPFTPWSTLEDVQAILRFVWESHLEDVVEPVQYGIELLVPPTSLLEVQDTFHDFDPASMSRRWSPSDARLEGLAARIRSIAAAAPDNALGFREVWRLVVGESLPARLPRRAPLPAALSEPWFCCAAPPPR
jgi:hypothetical protein